jgi:hypothetical protein
MGEFTSRVDQAIAKYGGADSNRQLQLKKLVRDYIGYQNYAEGMDKAGDQQINSDFSGMSPTGIKASLNSDVARKRQEVNHYESLMDKSDSVADSIAAKKIADEKAGATQSEADRQKKALEANNNPQDILAQEINKYNDNPYDENGNYISAQQFKESLKGSMGQGEGGAVGKDGAYLDEAAMNARVDERLGKDWDKNYGTQRYINQGYSKAEAANFYETDRAVQGKMQEHEYEMRAAQSPTWAETVQTLKQAPAIAKEIQPIESETLPGTKTVPISFSKLAENHPDIPPAKLAQLPQVKAAYGQALDGDIAIFFNNLQENVKATDTGYTVTLKDPTASDTGRTVETDANNWGEMVGTDEMKKQITTLAAVYDGVLTRQQIEQAMFKAVQSGKPVEWAKRNPIKNDVAAKQAGEKKGVQADILKRGLAMGVITKEQYDQQMSALK